MIVKRINRASAEQVFITVKNAFSGKMSVGHAVHWEFPIVASGTGTGDGYSVTFPATVATSQAYPGLMAGVVAGKDIPAGDYGSVQVYGYHTGVYITGMNDAGVPFDTDFFTVTNRTSASFTNIFLLPANAFANTTGGVTNAGYLGAASAITGAGTNVAFDAFGLWNLPHCIPLGNLNGNATVTTNSTGSVKAFIKCL